MCSVPPDALTPPPRPRLLRLQPPRSRILVSVTPRSEGSGQAAHLPAPCVPSSERIFVMCDGRQQTVTVDICNASGRGPPADEDTGAPAPLPAATAAVAGSAGAGVVVASPSVAFGEVSNGESGRAELVLQNTSMLAHTWLLSSVAQPYVRVADPRKGTFRSAYSAFAFDRQSGVIAAGATLRVPATFHPKNAGAFSQHWELRVCPKGMVTSEEANSKVNLHLTGVSARLPPTQAARAAAVAPTVPAQRTAPVQPQPRRPVPKSTAFTISFDDAAPGRKPRRPAHPAAPGGTAVRGRRQPPPKKNRAAAAAVARPGGDTASRRRVVYNGSPSRRSHGGREGLHRPTIAAESSVAKRDIVVKPASLTFEAVPAGGSVSSTLKVCRALWVVCEPHNRSTRVAADAAAAVDCRCRCCCC